MKNIKVKRKVNEIPYIFFKKILLSLLLDVSKLDSFAEFKKEVEAIVGENGVNVLYNNAGVSGESAVFPSLTPEGYINTFNVNTFGPVFLIQVVKFVVITIIIIITSVLIRIHFV